ncbi:hypothetical protein GI075_11320 [Salmonella enterica]|uniref:Uncharacterized protein n=2 Tax=Salmonella enterica TaxID=28901 RepID=A0A737B1Z8_SALNE|nr:hypothetical protein [Salmonella enterica]EDK2264264.1 hypothetical protein [Salmonella enterica subsp. enterica serovar Muenchen]EGY1029746.1 hypothetical protein [Salmonella enterica subsp. enterica serovar Hartford]EAQ4627327.1 hypothetical protein [Salmonella enterica]EAQ5932007.1 hypothetical protein [Salmonella enterica]EAR8245143.1 hypothetical protein [Salmonella enterica]
MESSVFKASTQYDDWQGSVAADGIDVGGLGSVLKTKGLMKDDEILYAIKLYSGVNYVSIEAFVGTDEQNLRKVDTQLTLEEFFKNFKRFSITLSRDGELEDKEISYE